MCEFDVNKLIFIIVRIKSNGEFREENNWEKLYVNRILRDGWFISKLK